MTTQVVFRIDKKVKDKAMKRAKAAGVPLASYFKAAARALADGRASMDIVTEEKFNAKTARELRSILNDIEKGRNIISFKNTKDMDDYLLSR